MTFTGALVVSILMFCGCTHAEERTVNCLTPISPENGQSVLYNQGRIVKYICNPGYILHGSSIAQCINNEWTAPPAVCFSPGDESSSSLKKDPLAVPKRPLFSWSSDKENATENDTSPDMISDEARLHMVLYPERNIRRVRILPPRMRTAAVRVQSGSELAEEQKKRSKEEATIELQSPVVYVRKPATPSKTLVYEDTLRRQYELAALRINAGINPDAAVVSLPRAAASVDDKSGQSDEALHQMYLLANNYYMYPRQAVVDHTNNPVVLTLSESQLSWINSLHPELRDRYLKDIYTTRAKEAEEGARAMEFLRRYEDVYNVHYNRPFYVRQPMAEISTYDYSCFYRDSDGIGRFIQIPSLPNTKVYRLESRINKGHPRNSFLSVSYECKDGYHLRNHKVFQLFCSKRKWVGEIPFCDPTAIKSCYVNNGGCKHLCVRQQDGHFVGCACHKGFTLASDGVSCLDIDECSKSNFGCSHTCVNIVGRGAFCQCPDDLKLKFDQKTCEGKHEYFGNPNQFTTPRHDCAYHKNGCQQRCEESDTGQFIGCKCEEGFRLDDNKLSCSDINECAENNFGCSDICVNVRGGAVCRCSEGFTLGLDRKTCKDINECAENNFECSHSCLNRKGSAMCSCPKGLTLGSDGKTCEEKYDYPGIPTSFVIPRHDCAGQNHGCEQECEESDTGHFIGCKCRQGFRLAANKKSCSDVDECANGNFECSHGCSNTKGSAVCHCPRGFTLSSDGKTCEDVNECRFERLNTCRHRCNNTVGSYICSCLPGYMLMSDNSCRDVDECANGNFGCSHGCSNTKGSAVCHCPRGFTLSSDGKTCEDVNECRFERLNTCRHRCNNTVGSYTCSCLPGYVLMSDNSCKGCRKNSYYTDSSRCEECPLHSHTVDEGMISISDCICDDGFIGDLSQDQQCTDVDECEIDNFGCSHTCVNTPGSAFCSCPRGFHLEDDQKICVDIDECAVKNGGCQGSCINLVGHFQCICPEGYTPSAKDAYSCDDIDECSEKNGSCNQICNNFPGGYFCSCEAGFRLDHTQKNCIRVTCPRIAEPRNTVMKCGFTHSERRNSAASKFQQNFPFQTVCTFNCKTGYEFSSPRANITCNEIGQWEGAAPECVASQCPPMKPPLNGYIEPKSCSKSGSNVLQKCVVICDPGYKLEGTFTFTCRRTLNWSPEILPKCIKKSILPHITCSPDIAVELNLSSNSIQLHIPSPISNVEDQYISVSPAWVNDANATFPFGVTDVVFTASSPTAPNTTATCTITVTVIDKEPPMVIDCPSSFDVTATSFGGATVLWEEPHFTDNVDIVYTSRTLEPNVTLSPGVYTVNYVASDSSGNIAECQFFINVTSIQCGDPTGPMNGWANCMDWSFGRICQPTCDPGYTFYADEPPLHMCDDAGVWSPSRKISDCTKYSNMTNSECPSGSELRIHEETGEIICVECPLDMIWSESTSTCLDRADFKDLIT